MKNIYILLLLISTICYSQHEDKIEFSVKSSKLVHNKIQFFEQRQVKIENDKLKIILVKVKVKTKKYYMLKPSAISLIDKQNKIRYRLSDYSSFYFWSFEKREFTPYRKTQLFTERGNPIRTYPPFDKSEKDYFYDFNMKGFTNFEALVNCGTKSKPELSILYFGRPVYEKFIARLYFPILAKNTGIKYELYYENEKISDIIL